METAHNLVEQPSLLSNKQQQILIRQKWRAYTKSHPKAQTAQELMVYHFLRFGHANECFTQISNPNKLNCNYEGNPLFTAQLQKRELEYSIRLYEKSSLNHPKEFMSHIWGAEFVQEHMSELSRLVATWNVSAKEPHKVQKNTLPKVPHKTELTLTN